MTLYFCPVKADDGYHYYIYDESPALFSEPQVSKRLSLAAFDRVTALLKVGAEGCELVQQQWSTHLLPGHELIQLHHLQTPKALVEEAAVLRIAPRDLWKQEWLEAKDFIFSKDAR